MQLPLQFSKSSTAQGKTVSATPYTPGIDVSSHQHKSRINWPLVARTGQKFAIIKATESTNYVNPFYRDDWQAAQDNGLVRAAYHFARPSQASGAQEADYFLNHLGPLSLTDFLVLDTEDDKVSDKADLLAHTLDFLTHVAAAVGFDPMIYSAHYYLFPHNLERHAELGKYGLYYADYSGVPPTIPPPWTFFAIWQYTSFGVVPGIDGPCDMDLFNGTLDQLKLYGKRN